MILEQIRAQLRAAAFVCKSLAACGALLALSLGAAQAAHAQGTRKDDVAYNALGRPMAGATIRVCTATATGQPCSPLAAVFSDLALTQPLANPLTADGLGNYTFYAKPGRYLIEITGPGIITKQFINVLIPSDPSAPDNFFAGNQHFAGPNPWIDVTAMTPPACPFQPNLEGGITGAINSGSTTLTMSSYLPQIANGCGVMVHGAGATSAMAAPTAVTIVNHNGSGATTYHYKIVAIDGNLHGTSPASAAAVTSTGVAAVSKYQYNYVTWAAPSGTPIGYIVYGDEGAGGAYSCLGVTRVAAWEDMGFYGANKPPCPVWAPATPPSAAGAQTLISTIVSGAGTNTLILANAAVNTVSAGLVHSDNTAAFTAAETIEGSNSGPPGLPRIVIPPGESFALAYMPSITDWNIEAHGSLFMSDGLGMDIPTNAQWYGNAQQATNSPGGSGYSAFVGATRDGPGATPTVDDAVVLLNASNTHVDGIEVWDSFNGVTVINASFITVSNIYTVSYPVGDGCALRIVGENVGPNIYGPGVLGATEDATSLGAVCIDGSISGGGGQVGSGNDHFRDLNWTGNWMYITCPINCTAAGDHSLQFATWDGGLGENQESFGGILLDPGTNSEGSTLGITSFVITNYDIDPDAFDGPIVTIMDVPNKSNAQADVEVNGAAAGPLSGSVSVTGAQNYSSVRSLINLMLYTNCSDGSGGKWAGANDWGAVKQDYAGTCVNGFGAGIQSNLGVYQGGNAFSSHNYNFATLIPPPVVASTTNNTAGTLSAGTYYYRLTSTDCASRESQPGPEVAVTVSASKAAVLNYTIGGGVLYGACGVNVYRGSSVGGENILLAAGAPVTTNLTTFTDTGSLTTSSHTPPSSGQAFESALSEQGGDFSYLFAAQSGNLYQKRMGFGTGTDPGPGSNIKWAFGGRTQFQSGVMVPLAAKSSAYTLTINDYWVNVTGTTTITVPHATAGQLWIVFNSGAGTVTLAADSGNINGASSVTLAANTGYTVLCDGSNCFATH